MVAQSSQGLRKAPSQRRPGRGYSIPLHTRTLAHNLYLFKDLPYKEISKETGLAVDQLERLAVREGWTKLKKERNARLEQQSIARLAGMESEVLESVVGYAGQHSIRAMDRVGESLERNDQNAARDFQSYTSGLKNLVTIIREIRAPAETTPTNSGLVAFVIRVGDDAKPPEVNVTPAVPVVTHNIS